MKTLHALIVGINQYKDGEISNLGVAVNDAQRIEQYFRTNSPTGYDLKIETLHDHEATRDGIIDAFKEYLIKPKTSKEDILLFYYAGHGSQEIAGDSFKKFSTNGHLENLVCHDAVLANGTGLIADKELRWLIFQATQSGAHFLNISDSCHSGGNTRGLESSDISKATPRMTSSAMVARNNSDFVFSDDIDFKQLEAGLLGDVIPQGNHISISACQSHEVAFELSPLGGIFTTALLEFLQRSKGNISYYDLKTRIKSYVRSQFDQSPQIYSSHKDPRMLFQTFLGGAMKDKPSLANVTYNFSINKWEIDLGAIHGVTKMWKGTKQEVISTNLEGEQLTSFVTKIYPAHSEIAFAPYSSIHKKEKYQALVPSMMGKQMSIQILGEESGIQILEKIPKEKLGKANLNFSREGSDFDYAIRATDNEYHITSSDNDQPLTGQELGYNDASAEKIIEKLSKIGTWNFAKNLKNSASKISNDSVKFEVFQNSDLLLGQNHIYTLDVHPDTLETPIKIGLTNNSGQKLYCGMIYLSSLFGMSPKLVQGLVQQIPNGKELWALEGGFITLSLEKYIQDLNWKEETFYVQVVVSNKEFGLELFMQEELDAPRGNSKGTTRGIAGSNWPNGPEPDWQTFLLEFRLRNPEIS